jgi:hypothetical protein
VLKATTFSLTDITVVFTLPENVTVKNATQQALLLLMELAKTAKQGAMKKMKPGDTCACLQIMTHQWKRMVTIQKEVQQ